MTLHVGQQVEDVNILQSLVSPTELDCVLVPRTGSAVLAVSCATNFLNNIIKYRF